MRLQGVAYLVDEIGLPELVDRVRWARRGNVAQRASCAQALVSTHSPRSTIRPDCSATGMNCPGDTAPRCG